MNRILIVKVGATFSGLSERKGDFEDWILAGMKVKPELVEIIDPREGAELPLDDGVLGAVVTGSHFMVTEREDWSERTALWIQKVVAKGIPFLGICYGHQLLAHALGGEVGNNPRGREFGTKKVTMLDAASSDALLGTVSSTIDAQLCHTQSVLKLPDNAKLLAESEMEPYQAFVVGKNVWGVQFHPEFDKDVVLEYINHYQEILISEGQKPDVLTEEASESPEASSLLKAFADICISSTQRL